MKTDFDILVIGGGAAGLTASGMSAVLGAKTALVSDAPLGGDCTWHGCVPSKGLLKAARVAHEMHSAAKYGLVAPVIVPDWEQIMGRVHAIREHIYDEADAPPNMAKLGVEVSAGRARFLDENSVEILDSQTQARRVVTARSFVIATGSRPKIPNIPGLERIPLLTNENLFEIGNNENGCSCWGRAPSESNGPGLPPFGVGCNGGRPGRAHSGTRRSSSPGCLSRRCEKRVSNFDWVRGWSASSPVSASGEERRSILRPDSCGHRKTAEHGISRTRGSRCGGQRKGNCGGSPLPNNSQKYLRLWRRSGASTSLPTWPDTHRQGRRDECTCLHIPSKVDESHVPWCTFTDPELAHVGTGGGTEKTRSDLPDLSVPVREAGSAITDSAPVGLVKVFANKRGKILGASILGANAGEMIAEYALAMKVNAKLCTISATIHPYPTYALGNRRTADIFTNKILTPWRVSWIKRLLGLRGATAGVSILNEEHPSAPYDRF